MAEKLFILDTNVLINDPNALYRFDKHEVLIPIAVLFELDHLKSGEGSKAYSARAAARNILKETRKDKTTIKLEYSKDFNFVASSCIDDQIISFCLKVKNRQKKRETILVTDDTLMTLKASSVGLNVESYKAMEINTERVVLPAVNVQSATYHGDYVRCEDSNKLFVYTGGRYRALKERSHMFGIHPLNDEQETMFDALQDDSADLVFLEGPAGCGKTLCATAYALQCVLEGMRDFDRVYITRPLEAMDDGVGYLPGDEQEKMSAWVKPFLDSIRFLTKGMEDADLFFADKFEAVAPSFIQGRSFMNALIIVDEVQNFSKMQIKQMITRLGKDSKMILMGDADQIASRFLNKYNNGLTYAGDKLEGLRMVRRVLLEHSFRSELAREAVKRL